MGGQESKPSVAKCLSVFLALTETTSHQVTSRSTGDELLMCLLLIILLHRLKEIKQLSMHHLLHSTDISSLEMWYQSIWKETTRNQYFDLGWYFRSYNLNISHKACSFIKFHMLWFFLNILVKYIEKNKEVKN